MQEYSRVYLAVVVMAVAINVFLVLQVVRTLMLCEICVCVECCCLVQLDPRLDSADTLLAVVMAS